MNLHQTHCVIRHLVWILVVAVASILIGTSPLFAQDQTAISENPLSEIQNFGITVMYTATNDSKDAPPNHAMLYKSYYNNKGMFRVEMTFLDASGNKESDWVYSYDGERTYYYDAMAQVLTLAKNFKISSYLLDTATRFTFYPLQFLSPNKENPLNEKGQYIPTYKAFYIADIFDVKLWTEASKLLKLLESKGGGQTYQINATDSTNPEASKEFTLKLFQDANSAYIPFHVQKIDKDGKVTEEFKISEWTKTQFKNGQNGESSINIPKKAEYATAGEKQYSYTVEISNVEINSPALEDSDFYTVDLTSALRIFDFDSQKMISVPK